MSYSNTPTANLLVRYIRVLMVVCGVTNLQAKFDTIGEQFLSSENTVSEVESKMSSLDYIASGEGRHVFRIDGKSRVVKFASNRTRYKGGVDQNQYESFLWEESNESERAVLAPVLDSDNKGLWLTMRYAEPVPDSYNLEPIRDEIYELLEGKVDSTFRRKNFGVIDGKIKLVDYGYSMNG